MTLITISVAISIVLTIGAISLALEEHLFTDLARLARVEWVNLRSRIGFSGGFGRPRRPAPATARNSHRTS